MPLSTRLPASPPALPIRPLVPPQPVRRISAWPFLSGRAQAPAGDIEGNARRVIAITTCLYQEPVADAARQKSVADALRQKPMAGAVRPQARKG